MPHFVSDTRVFGRKKASPASLTLRIYPCDFCFFPKTKTVLKGKRFDNIPDILDGHDGAAEDLFERSLPEMRPIIES